MYPRKIQNLFGGNIRDFLNQGCTVFSGLWNLLRQQMQRLSPLQQQIMFWLAITPEVETPAQLQKKIVPPVTMGELLTTLEALLERSLIEATEIGLTQQPIIMEYTREHLIRAVERELMTGELQLLKAHTLIESQAEDDLWMVHVQPTSYSLTEELLTRFTSPSRLEAHLHHLLATLRHQSWF
jgi:hypothetical protein